MRDVSPESTMSSTRNAWVNHSTHDRETKQGSFSKNLRPLSLQATTRRDETIVLANPQTFSSFVCGYDNIGAIQTSRLLNAMTRREPREHSNLRLRPTIYAMSRNPLSSTLTKTHNFLPFIILIVLSSVTFYLLQPHLSFELYYIFTMKIYLNKILVLYLGLFIKFQRK